MIWGRVEDLPWWRTKFDSARAGPEDPFGPLAPRPANGPYGGISRSLGSKIEFQATARAGRFAYRSISPPPANDPLVAGIAEAASGALGHAGVATWPDKPFLVWTAVFEHEVPDREVRQHRDNPKTFLEGCRALHKMFCKVGREAPHLKGRIPTRFAEIEERVQGILATVGDKGVRSEAWKAASMEGAFTGAQEEIPPYVGHDWLETLEDWRSRQRTDRAVRSQEVVDSDTFRFYQAAAIHRTFVLRDLLPTHGLAVN